MKRKNNNENDNQQFKKGSEKSAHQHYQDPEKSDHRELLRLHERAEKD